VVDFSSPHARVLWVVTGAVQAAAVPSLVVWVQNTYPHLEMHIALSPGAERFVSPLSLREFSGHQVVLDRWQSNGVGIDDHHLRIVQDYDAYMVWPMTLGYCSKLVACGGDGPVLLALSLATHPIIVYPAFPPGARDNPLVGELLAKLETRPNVRTVLPLKEGNSLRNLKPNNRAEVDPSVVFRVLQSALT